MNLRVHQLHTLFRDYASEPTTVFLSDDDIALYLEIAYGNYRSLIANRDPLFLQQSQNIVVTGNSYELDGAEAVVLLGSAANPLMEELIEVQRLDNNGDYAWTFEGVSSQRQVGFPETSFHAVGPERVYLEGSTLRFEYDQNGQTNRLVFIGKPTVDWSKKDPADNEYIDDTRWHDIIALLAYRHYAVRDGATNPEVERLLATRQDQMTRDLARGRFSGADAKVQLVTDW